MTAICRTMCRPVDNLLHVEKRKRVKEQQGFPIDIACAYGRVGYVYPCYTAAWEIGRTTLPPSSCTKWYTRWCDGSSLGSRRTSPGEGRIHHLVSTQRTLVWSGGVCRPTAKCICTGIVSAVECSKVWLERKETLRWGHVKGIM